jgi:hypothetical protein
LPQHRCAPAYTEKPHALLRACTTTSPPHTSQTSPPLGRRYQAITGSLVCLPTHGSGSPWRSPQPASQDYRRAYKCR